MSILITGGTGFIGSYLAKKLVEEGEDEFVLMDVLLHPVLPFETPCSIRGSNLILNYFGQQCLQIDK
jgi:nucleoside-diphosphate-sugar epimerase